MLLSGFALFGFLSGPQNVSGGGAIIYKNSKDLPEASKVPKYLTLVSAPESSNGVSVRAMLVERVVDEKKTEGRVGFHGKLTSVRRFVRIEILTMSSLALPSVLKVVYSVKHNEELTEREDSVIIREEGLRFFVDFDGFEDKVGAEVSDSSEITSEGGKVGVLRTSTKVEYTPSEIVKVHVSVADPEGHLLFAGGWPQGSEEIVTLPERLKPRTFQDSQGRSVAGTVLFLGTQQVTLGLQGRNAEIDLEMLSETDRGYLSELLLAMEALRKKLKGI